jgi:phosphopantetheinyl transferase
MSHCDELAVYAFSHGRELGIDLEAIRPVGEADAIAERFFAPGEQQIYRSLTWMSAAAGFPAALDAQGGAREGPGQRPWRCAG